MNVFIEPGAPHAVRAAPQIREMMNKFTDLRVSPRLTMKHRHFAIIAIAYLTQGGIIVTGDVGNTDRLMFVSAEKWIADYDSMAHTDEAAHDAFG